MPKPHFIVKKKRKVVPISDFKRSKIIDALKNSKMSYSQIADIFKVSKASVVALNSQARVRVVSKKAATLASNKLLFEERNKTRAIAIEKYIKRFGLKNGKIAPVGVSINHMMQYLKSIGVSPGTKRNLELLISRISKKIEQETGLRVIRRTRSSQPKRY